MARILGVLVAMALVVGLPFLLKPKENLLAQADETLIIISPHNEAIRYEFGRAFAEYYKKKTGRTIRVDWRNVGGTSEIAKYLASEFYTAFERAWKESGQPWTREVQAAFADPSIQLPDNPNDDTPAQAARRAFLNSDVGIGIDLFFGGGAYDYIQQAEAGRLVDCGLIPQLPEVFNNNSIPQMVSGEPFYDQKGRWIGACVSSFGICYNTDSLERLGVTELPAAWTDLANPRFFKQVALADPTKSGSAAKAFEMIIQQQMQQRLTALQTEHPDKPYDEIEAQAIREGWIAGLQLIQKISANARYFTDAASKVPMDVSLGDAAIGMCIDFFGRFQSEAVRIEDGSSRLQYFTPAGGSSVGVDPIGLLRGAPNREAAQEFIRFVLSLEGQKLWNFKVGTPGGPVRYALRRLPVRKELYEPQYAPFRSDPDVDPYEEAKLFTYHEKWTGPLFRSLSFIIRVLCLDPHDEQSESWKALIQAGFPPKALAAFEDLNSLNYDFAMTIIRPALRSADRLEEVRLAKELGDQFRRQYAEAIKLSKEAE